MKKLLLLSLSVLILSCQKKSIITDDTNTYLAKIDTVEVYSKSMNTTINNIVILPTNYEALINLPVVYLLHGASGNYTDWLSNVSNLDSFCADNNIIIVCPDGGFNSWYFDSPIDSSFMYETFISEELILYIDSIYPTSRSSSKRAVTGLSMGGHGAFYLAIRNQDVYGAAGSMSGALDIRPFSNSWNISDRIGSIDDFPKNWELNTVTNMVDLLQGSDLELFFDCGSDDFFINVNNVFHEKLILNNIEHVYNVKSGSHDWNYWSVSVFEHLTFFNDYFRK